MSSCSNSSSGGIKGWETREKRGGEGRGGFPIVVATTTRGMKKGMEGKEKRVDRCLHWGKGGRESDR